MKNLHISPDISLPLDTATQTIAILARKRVGKTYTASVMSEELIKAEIPLVVLDPTGAWWGLRASADGKREGFPVVIIGGAHGDVPLEETAGKVIADLVVDHPGYYVIDFSQIEHDAAMRRFANEFGKRFYFRKEEKRFAIQLIIDEADIFAPQNPGKEQTQLLHTYDNIVRRGGIRGIGVTMISQRPAVLNKNILTQCETLLVLQISGSQDVDAIEHWMRIHGTKEERAEFLGSVATLQRGEAWLWSPSWLQVFKKIHIRERETFNSSATPKAGEKLIVPAKLAPVDIAKLGEQIKATAERAKENDPAELKKQLATLKRELALKPMVEMAKPLPPKEIHVVSDDELAAVSEAAMAWNKLHTALNTTAQEVRAQFKTVESIHVRLLHLKSNTIAHQRFAEKALMRPANTPVPRLPAPRRAAHTIESNGDFRITSTQQRILDALAWFESIGTAEPSNLQVGAVALIDSAGGHFSNTVGPLSSNGLVNRGNGGMSLTDEGRKYARVPEQLSSMAEYHDMLRKRIRQVKSAGGKTVEMLDAIIARGGEEITTAEIGEAVGIDPTGGHFSNMIGPLGGLGLITRRDGVVRPTEILFPEALA